MHKLNGQQKRWERATAPTTKAHKRYDYATIVFKALAKLEWTS